MTTEYEPLAVVVAEPADGPRRGAGGLGVDAHPLSGSRTGGATAGQGAGQRPRHRHRVPGLHRGRRSRPRVNAVAQVPDATVTLIVPLVTDGYAVAAVVLAE